MIGAIETLPELDSQSFKQIVGTRASKLARIQTQFALDRMTALLPALRFDTVPLPTPGDKDLRTDLRDVPADFFTRDLDDAVRDGRLNAALHSAKDVPDPLPDGLDECWLPWREDPRDVLVLRRGLTLDTVVKPVIGVSSERRDAYARQQFPGAVMKPIRGNIEQRLRQLDAGDYDILLMAAAALMRLDLADRISAWIAPTALATPAGQGILALTFRAADKFWLRLRSLFVKPVVFAGAGAGSYDTCTVGAVEAMARCDICFYDSLLDTVLLDRLPPHARRVDVGKRCGNHRMTQHEINGQLIVAARRGYRVVRLKGGDPGFFGRLTEEIESLDAARLPYRVLPGVSSLNVATSGTGLLLTQRGIARGFTVMTPRRHDGAAGSVQAEARAALPIAFFMGIGVLPEIVRQLRAEGMDTATPAAVVFDAGSLEETVIRGTLTDIAGKISASRHRQSSAGDYSRPGLILIGSPAARTPYPRWGALSGRRVLLPCSVTLIPKAMDAVRDLDGIPLPLPLLRMVRDPGCLHVLQAMRDYDWLVVTSPSSVRMLMQQLPAAGIDLRALPRILVSGSGTAATFKHYGITPDIVPDRHYGTKGVVNMARQHLAAGAAVLRLRSRQAGPDLAQALTAAGFKVRDTVLYNHVSMQFASAAVSGTDDAASGVEVAKPGSPPENIPPFDAVFFASASAVTAFMSRSIPYDLADKTVMAIGQPTLAALTSHGIHVARLPLKATVGDGMAMLAAVMLEDDLKDENFYQNKGT